MENENTNNVVKHIRIGGIEATVWKYVNGGREFLSVTLKRNYKDASGEWKSTPFIETKRPSKGTPCLAESF